MSQTLLARAEAPSNIALIKYMGKSQAASNRPANASLSYTLNHLRTVVEIHGGVNQDQWVPIDLPGWQVKLGAKGQHRFLAHFKRLKMQWQIPGNYQISSANNFPSDCGLASSASSFAALTKATYELARAHSLDRAAIEALSLEQISAWSRQGSGSSCRSLFSPWALWREEYAEGLDLPYGDLIHHAVVVEGTVKEVSSSEAHLRVTSSLLFQGRVERAESRLRMLVHALSGNHWRQAFEIVWAEMWDMHSLFETSEPAFGYMAPESLQVLHQVRELWKQHGDGPLVTMDAGANVHLLWRRDQAVFASTWAQEFKGPGVILSSERSAE